MAKNNIHNIGAKMRFIQADLQKDAYQVSRCLLALSELVQLSLEADKPISATLLERLISDSDSKAMHIEEALEHFKDTP